MTNPPRYDQRSSLPQAELAGSLEAQRCFVDPQQQRDVVAEQVHDVGVQVLSIMGSINWLLNPAPVMTISIDQILAILDLQPQRFTAW